jgi:hypothetical protein
MQAVAQPQLVKTSYLKAQNRVVLSKPAPRPTVSRKPVARFLDFLMIALSASTI